MERSRKGIELKKANLWGRERSVSDFPALAAAELQRILSAFPPSYGIPDPFVMHARYRNAIKSCGVLYDNAAAMEALLSGTVLDAVRNGISEEFGGIIEKKGSITHFVFDGLLPIRYFYARESSCVRDLFQNPVRKALQEARADGRVRVYDGKVVLCFVNYFANGEVTVDHHGFEVKPVIDCLRQFLFRDDDPGHVAIHSRCISGAERTHSELFIVPFAEFPDFAADFAAGSEECRTESAGNQKTIKETIAEDARRIHETSELFVETLERENWDEVAGYYSRLLLDCGGLLERLKLSAYQEGVGDADLEENALNAAASVIPLSAEDGIKRYRLEGLMEKIAKGADKRKAIKRISPSLFPEIGSTTEGTVISFIHHFGKCARLTDHDNFATVAYARGILRAMGKDYADYYMDCVTEDEKDGFTEIFVTQRDKFEKQLGL